MNSTNPPGSLKHILCLGVILVVLLFNWVSLASECQNNTLCNGDFEQHLKFWQSTHNVKLTDGLSDKGILVSHDYKNSDIYQTINGLFHAGKSYRVTAWCLADIGEQCGLFFGDANRLENPAPYEHTAGQTLWGTGNWQQLSVQLTLNHEERMDVYVYSKILGSAVIYDDVRLEEVHTYPLKVVKTGNGTGTVTGMGIDCGSDCQGNYPDGTILHFKAIPDKFSTFRGWLVNGKPFNEAIPVGETVTVTAIFEKESQH